MKKSVSIAFGLFLALGAGAALAAVTAVPVSFTPDGMHWTAGTGPGKGTSNVVLAGNPSKSGTSIIRVKMPDGYVNKPHYHAHPEYITVVQGTLLFGTGDTVNTAKATVLPTGSFIVVPTGVHHWSVTKGETIEQIDGEGPLTNIPIKHGSM